MLLVNIPYRARGLHTFRKTQLYNLINNCKEYFKLNNIEFKIIIIEQNGDELFNRGKLLNIAFLESEKLFSKYNVTYMHINCDYTFNINHTFPKNLLYLDDNFYNLFNVECMKNNSLGGCCLFNSKLFNSINGFPNNFYGWGGEDRHIYYRCLTKNIKIIETKYTNKNKDKSKNFINDENNDNITDTSKNIKHLMASKINDIQTNGLTNCKYKIVVNGEFDDNTNNIYHFIVNL